MAFENSQGRTQVSEEEWFRSQFGDSNPLGLPTPPKRRKKASGGSILMLGVLALAGIGAVLFTMNLTKAKSNPNDTDDLGQGVNNGAGLRGHLVTRWQNGKAQYQLKIEPIDPRANDGFALVTGSPLEPIAINVRVLDSSGFALCGKQILVPFDPAKAGQADVHLPKNKAEADKLLAARQADLQRMRAAEQARESGKDVFEDIAGSDGKIEALWAQGGLPCSPDQYRRFDYWDMTTNFPTLPEQQALLNRKSDSEKKKSTAEERAAAERRAAAAKKPASEFYIQGDDHITAFEPSRGLLHAGPGRSFFIDRKPDQAVVAAWANDLGLIHFRCDQHAVCAITHPGSATVVVGKMDE
jgi:hypothetical protein